MESKKRILVLGDSPIGTSGVGRQLKNIISSLLKTHKYHFMCLAGALKHMNYNPIQVKEFGEDVIIYPVDGFGTPDMIRSIMVSYRPDMVLIMTDPRFFVWLWEIENEIRQHAPIVYYHVWDNFPIPYFNKPLYSSNDYIACISKLTHECVQNVSPNVLSSYVPHSVDSKVYYKLTDKEIKEAREKYLPESNGKTLFFWNNRNARRKMAGTLIYWFKTFLDTIKDNSAMLLMHTDAVDPNGQDLPYLINNLGMNNGEIKLSTQRVDDQMLNLLYNMTDATINISNAEGFGLSAIESLSCGTPIIVNMTGGLQEQVTKLSRHEIEKEFGSMSVLYGKDFYGAGIIPASKTIVGDTRVVPYIYEDNITEKDFVHALYYIHSIGEDRRNELGKNGLNYVRENYSFETFEKTWQDIFEKVADEFGSYENRKNYKPWEIINV